MSVSSTGMTPTYFPDVCDADTGNVKTEKHLIATVYALTVLRLARLHLGVRGTLTSSRQGYTENDMLQTINILQIRFKIIFWASLMKTYD